MVVDSGVGDGGDDRVDGPHEGDQVASCDEPVSRGYLPLPVSGEYQVPVSGGGHHDSYHGRNSVPCPAKRAEESAMGGFEPERLSRSVIAPPLREKMASGGPGEPQTLAPINPPVID